MADLNQKGFSLIEILIVVVIMGIISAFSVPYLKKAKYAAENAAIYSTTKIMSKEQLNFFVQKSRYARLDELNTLQSNGFGATSSNTIQRGNFTFTMSPTTPTDTELRTDYTILATKTIDASDVPYVISINSTGEIVQIIP
jgi:prepilin-type N-terminal cleavage/methylation domain-containing protein